MVCLDSDYDGADDFFFPPVEETPFFGADTVLIFDPDPDGGDDADDFFFLPVEETPFFGADTVLMFDPDPDGGDDADAFLEDVLNTWWMDLTR